MVDPVFGESPIPLLRSPCEMTMRMRKPRLGPGLLTSVTFRPILLLLGRQDCLALICVQHTRLRFFSTPLCLKPKVHLLTVEWANVLSPRKILPPLRGASLPKLLIPWLTRRTRLDRDGPSESTKNPVLPVFNVPPPLLTLTTICLGETLRLAREKKCRFLFALPLRQCIRLR